VEAGGTGDVLEVPPLHPVPGQSVALGAPTMREADREHAGVLARAVVLERRRRISRRPALELALGGGHFRKQRTHGCELFYVCEMRGRDDREVAIVEVGSRSSEGDGLDRLGGRTHERDEAGIAGLRDDCAVLYGDRVHAMDRLDHIST